MKFLALNLPQFHRVKENDEWWGEGFTEWTNVKKAKPLYSGHVQPMEPLDDYYYDLSKKEDINRQAILAKKYGIGGFVYFHYWYEGRKMLEKPCEILLDSPDIDIDYCFCWANHSWTRAWDGKEHEVLLEQTYGGESDWKAHIDYLLPFFKDNRYIKNDNMPMLVLYNASVIPYVDKMIEYWNKEVKKEGFDGIYLVEYISSKNLSPHCNYSQAVYEDEPIFSLRFEISNLKKLKRVIVKKMKWIEYQDYDELWHYILEKKRTYNGRKIIQGAVTAWDNSPRRGAKGPMIVRGSTPKKFRNYLYHLAKSNRKDASEDYIIINAWNEWGEGAILEPTKKDGDQYLKAVKAVIMKISENKQE